MLFLTHDDSEHIINFINQTVSDIVLQYITVPGTNIKYVGPKYQVEYDLFDKEYYDQGLIKSKDVIKTLHTRGNIKVHIPKLVHEYSSGVQAIITNVHLNIIFEALLLTIPSSNGSLLRIFKITFSDYLINQLEESPYECLSLNIDGYLFDKPYKYIDSNVDLIDVCGKDACLAFSKALVLDKLHDMHIFSYGSTMQRYINETLGKAVVKEFIKGNKSKLVIDVVNHISAYKQLPKLLSKIWESASSKNPSIIDRMLKEHKQFNTDAIQEYIYEQVFYSDNELLELIPKS